MYEGEHGKVFQEELIDIKEINQTIEEDQEQIQPLLEDKRLRSRDAHHSQEPETCSRLSRDMDDSSNDSEQDRDHRNYLEPVESFEIPSQDSSQVTESPKKVIYMGTMTWKERKDAIKRYLHKREKRLYKK